MGVHVNRPSRRVAVRSDETAVNPGLDGTQQSGVIGGDERPTAGNIQLGAASRVDPKIASRHRPAGNVHRAGISSRAHVQIAAHVQLASGDIDRQAVSPDTGRQIARDGQLPAADHTQPCVDAEVEVMQGVIARIGDHARVGYGIDDDIKGEGVGWKSIRPVAQVGPIAADAACPSHIALRGDHCIGGREHHLTREGSGVHVDRPPGGIAICNDETVGNIIFRVAAGIDDESPIAGKIQLCLAGRVDCNVSSRDRPARDIELGNMSGGIIAVTHADIAADVQCAPGDVDWQAVATRHISILQIAGNAQLPAASHTHSRVGGDKEICGHRVAQGADHG